MERLFKKLSIFIKKIYYLNARQKELSFSEISIPLKHYLVLISILTILLGINIYHKFSIYKDLKNGLSFEARIVNHYQKIPKPKSKSISEIVKFQDSYGNVYYGTYRGRFKNLKGLQARVYGKIYNCTFWQFFKGCRIYNSTFDILPITPNKAKFVSFIESQHEIKEIANLFSTLFFAETLNKKARDSATALGISHLIAISGFHLASISALFLCFITPFYFLLHRFYCYRNAFFDLSALTLIFGFFYLLLIDFQPSFLRAYLMALAGFIVIYCGIKILNLANLFLCAIFAIALNPNLVCNIGFILSVVGVYFIFLFMKYIGSMESSKIKGFFIKFILFNTLLFLQISPIAHAFIPLFSTWQIVSIPISIIFPLIFPLLAFLHIIGCGGVFDKFIESILLYDYSLHIIEVPIWFLIPYLCVCMLAMRYKIAYIFSILMGAIFYGYNIALV